MLGGWRAAGDDPEDAWTDHTRGSAFEDAVFHLSRRLERLLACRAGSAGGDQVAAGTEEEDARQRQLPRVEWVRGCARQSASESSADARQSFAWRWFGVRGDYLLAGTGAGVLVADRSQAQYWLSCLSVAMRDVQLCMPCFVAYGRGAYVGFTGGTDGAARLLMESEASGRGWSTIKLDTVQRMFRATFFAAPAATSANRREIEDEAYSAMTTTTKTGVRFTWQVRVSPQSASRTSSTSTSSSTTTSTTTTTSTASSLMGKLRISAVWPLALPSSSSPFLAENDIFSTLTPESAPVWAVLCVWNGRRPITHDGGPGAYDDGSASSQTRLPVWAMIPMSTGLARLVACAAAVTTTTPADLNSTSASINDDENNDPPFHSEEGDKDLARARQLFEARGKTFVNSVAQRMKLSRLAGGRFLDSAVAIVNEAFQRSSSSSPFTRMVLALARLVAPSDDVGICRTVVDKVWALFCAELRARFENRDVTLFSSSDGLEPDASRSAVQQKVCVVRYCAKMLASGDSPKPVVGYDNTRGGGDNDGGQGRKRELDFFLKSRETVRAWEPHTQPPNPWSHHEDDLSTLAREVRAELSSPNLVSDMRAFAAANPGCQFVDFLKWFSPRDVDRNANEPSERMASGMWRTAWDAAAASALPASMQKPVFDPVQVGEKALHWLEALRFERLIRECVQEACFGMKQELVHEQERVHVPPCLGAHDDVDSLPSSHVLDAFAELEHRHTRLAVLRENAAALPSFVRDALVAGDGAAEFTDPADRQRVRELVLLPHLLDDGDEGLKRPDKREYMLSLEEDASGGGSRRLYVATMMGELQVARVVDL